MGGESQTEAIDRNVLLGTPKSRRRSDAIPAVLTGVLLAGVLLGALRAHGFTSSLHAPAPPAAPDLVRALTDLRPIQVTLTTPAWLRLRETVTVDRLRTDRTLWTRMHFGDWDRLAPAFREPALRRMLRLHAPVLSGPAVWRAMSVADWDRVPQPIRAMAYLRMIWYWARFEDVGSEFGLEPELLAQTIAAIVMAESWFEHRAVNENARGRDLGLAQCSHHCRRTLAAMAADYEILFTPSEEDYFDPWIAARVATVWFERELRRAGGDVALAVRAYHRGLDNAMDEKGDRYLERVVRLREQYIRLGGASPTWRFVARELNAYPRRVPTRGRIED